MMRSVRYLWAMLATLAFLTQSCDHKDLCYRNEHHTELEIKFDCPIRKDFTSVP